MAIFSSVWSVPKTSSDEAYLSLPVLPAGDVDTARKIDWWNARIVEETGDSSIKIVAGGHTVLPLA